MIADVWLLPRSVQWGRGQLEASLPLRLGGGGWQVVAFHQQLGDPWLRMHRRLCR